MCAARQLQVWIVPGGRCGVMKPEPDVCMVFFRLLNVVLFFTSLFTPMLPVRRAEASVCWGHGLWDSGRIRVVQTIDHLCLAPGRSGELQLRRSRRGMAVGRGGGRDRWRFVPLG
ncbi:hypothetical protein NDU88_007344 [Pleurodeles waltl]|uniref:Secreted protein n=1 Tax=Pleurodeles waltl TaxID=8319 RepID=A0AAV7N1T2_PLEWA|nr:hypothetical protein NDU88_007344 [Pleurodeles waltl]